MREFRVFAYGGGVQSTAVLVLERMGVVKYDHYVFANVGDDSENPDTLEYFREVAKPYADQHGIDLVELKRERTLREWIYDNGSTIPIPMILKSGNPGRRACTVHQKIRLIDKWVRWHKDSREHYTVGLGISLDEYQRAKSTEPVQIFSNMYKQLEYPLLDLRLSRYHCKQIIEDAGLSVPPKSSCFFCPFHKTSEWVQMSTEKPDLFEEVCRIEKYLQSKRNDIGKDKMYISYKQIPLEQVVKQYKDNDKEQDINCDNGYCFI